MQDKTLEETIVKKGIKCTLQLSEKITKQANRNKPTTGRFIKYKFLLYIFL